MQPEIQLDLPYLTTEIPGVGGRIRASADDFQVEEIPLYPPLDEGQHLYVNLTKVGLTTRDVATMLGKAFGAVPKSIGFAGMKDKHARTSQSFSIPVGHVEASFPDEAARLVEEKLPVTVNWARLHRNKLRRGHLLGNRFRIRLTDFEGDWETVLARCHIVADTIRSQGLANFYGPQRLGVRGNNVVRGLAIFNGDRSVRQRWLRNLLLASVQSYLCNLYLAERLEAGLFEQILPGDVAKKYETGGLFTVDDVEREQKRFDAKEISFTAPIYGLRMRRAEGAAGEREDDLLRRSGLTMEMLGLARLAGSRRLGRLLIPDLEIHPDDGALLFTFSLPKGAFATTVLREFMKVDYETLAAFAVEE